MLLNEGRKTKDDDAKTTFSKKNIVTSFQQN
jgi:hypothetical protein